MPGIYKFTAAIALFTLVLVGLSFLIDYKGAWLLGLLFLMPVLWTLWLVCAVRDKDRKIWQLILLWVLIDITVLGVASLLMGNRRDTEIFYTIAFSPLILPVIFGFAFSSVIGAGLSAIAQGGSNLLLLGSFENMLSDWLGFSILSAISSYLFVSLYHYRKWLRARKREPS